MGDVLLTLPAAAALRHAIPDAHIAYLVRTGLEGVSNHCPYVDQTLALPFPHPESPALPQGWAKTVERAAEDLRGRFDLALVLRPDDPWSSRLVAGAGIPIRIGYDLPRTRPFLTHVLASPWRLHAVYLALQVAAAAASSLGRAWHVPPHLVRRSPFRTTREEEAEAEAVMSETGLSDPVIIHPGSSWPLKNWPPLRWAKLAAALREEYGISPLVLGGSEEQELVATVVAASGQAALGLAGRLSLGGLAALHRRARLVVATDSGPVHLATFAGAPVVGLYGPADHLVFAPCSEAERHRVVRVPLPCSPCGTLVNPPCGAVSEPSCVASIEVEAVLAACSDLLLPSTHSAKDRPPRVALAGQSRREAR